MDITEQNKAYLCRVQLFLEDGEWENATQYCEKVLDTDPTNAQAYLYELLIEQQVKTPEALAQCRPFAQSKHYQKVLRFGDAQLVSVLTQLNEQATQREIAANKSGIYQEAMSLMAQGTEEYLMAAAARFQRIPGWQDADAQLAVCRERIAAIRAQAAMQAQAEMQAAAAAKAAPSPKKSRKKWILFGGIGAAMLVLAGILLAILLAPKEDTSENLFENGLAPVKLDGKYDYINEKGEMVIQAQFDDARPFSKNGLAAVAMNGKWGYINEKGKLVIPAQFDDAWSFSENGLARVIIDEKWGYINEKGKFVVYPQFDSADSFPEYGLARVRIDEKWGYINEKGEMVIPAQFEWADPFSKNGLAPVELDGKWAVINEKGEPVIDALYSCAYLYDDGYVVACKNGKWGILDTRGNVVVDFLYDGISGHS